MKNDIKFVGTRPANGIKFSKSAASIINESRSNCSNTPTSEGRKIKF